jgi:hypothetical protein
MYLAVPVIPLLLLCGGAVAQDESEPLPVEPAAEGGLREGPFTVSEHWTPYAPPIDIPAGTRVHIVVRGDTLWDLAGYYLNDNFLWPQLWEANGYITDANLIYPGDPIVLPEPQVVTEEAIEQELAEPEPALPQEEPTFAPRPQPPLPHGLDSDVWCSGYVQPPEDNPIEIIGAEYEHVGQATGDVVYINRGDADGVLPGDEFFIVRRENAVRHPRTHDYIGHYHQFGGRLKIVVTQEHTSTAQITFSCDAIQRGDDLLPFTDFVRPVRDADPLVDRFARPSGKLSGTIIDNTEHILSVGQGDTVVIDVGSRDGILPGDYFTIFNEQRGIHGEELPRHNKGVLVILIPMETTSVARITHSLDEVHTGDQVELQ